MKTVIDFLDRIEGAGYGGVADFEIARTDARDAAAEIERLTSALESCQSWIELHTQHVGRCEGGDKCTCGRSAILFEASAALAGDEQSDAKGR